MMLQMTYWVTGILIGVSAALLGLTVAANRGASSGLASFLTSAAAGGTVIALVVGL